MTDLWNSKPPKKGILNDIEITQEDVERIAEQIKEELKEDDRERLKKYE